MTFEATVYAYHGVPLELAQAAARELERATDFLDLRANASGLTEEQEKAANVRYTEWKPPVLKDYLRLNLTEENGGRQELRKGISDLEDEMCNEWCSFKLAYLKQSPVDYDRLAAEEAFKNGEGKELCARLDALRADYQRHFPGQHWSSTDWIKAPARLYDLSRECLRQIEDCIVADQSLDSFLIVKDVLPYYKCMSEAGIKLTVDDIQFEPGPLSDGGQRDVTVLFPFIGIYRPSLSWADKIVLNKKNPYCLARGGISLVTNNNLAPRIGEAIYFWNKGEKQNAVDWATFALVHEFAGHAIGKLEDIPFGDYTSNWSVMRVPLNALTLQEEIGKVGRDTRLRFTEADRKRIAENVRAKRVA